MLIMSTKFPITKSTAIFFYNKKLHLLAVLLAQNTADCNMFLLQTKFSSVFTCFEAAFNN
jgi:hypothetical protein